MKRGITSELIKHSPVSDYSPINPILKNINHIGKKMAFTVSGGSRTFLRGRGVTCLVVVDIWGVWWSGGPPPEKI